MLTPINDEITEREPYNGYLVYQGGVSEVDEFVKKVHKQILLRKNFFQFTFVFLKNVLLQKFLVTIEIQYMIQRIKN